MPLNRPLFIKDHQERLLCPLPLAIDNYRGCSTACAYCSLNGLRTGVQCGAEVSANSVVYIEKFFYHHKTSMERQLIDQRVPIQVGVSSDPLQPAEKQHHVTLRVLKVLRDKNYPVVITSKYPGQLVGPAYLRAIDALPLVVQCSICSADPTIVSQLEPRGPSIPQRLKALRILASAGVHVQLRLWPFIPDLCGNLDVLLGAAHDAGVKVVQANPLKVYHSGTRERINAALGRDYLATTPLRYENHGVFSVPCPEDQAQDLSRLKALCRKFGMKLLNCDDCEGRGWQSCCGVDGLPGFEGIARWAYFVNGHRIREHTETDFETYMAGHCCPWHDEFEQQWEAGKLAESIPELRFNRKNKTYTRLKACVEIQEKEKGVKKNLGQNTELLAAAQ